MKIYFLSSRPCALMLGGVYFGMTDGFERFAEVSVKDHLYAQFLPEGGLPVGFFITENLRFSPPEHVDVYLLRDGVAVYVHDFPPADFSFKLIAQERFSNTLVTVFRQGGVRLSLETERGFFPSELSDDFDPCKILFESGLVFLIGNGAFAVYTAYGACVLKEKASEIKVENGELKAVLPLSDSGNRVAECVWRLDERGVEQTSFKIGQAEGAPQAELLPYAFFETVLVGGDYAALLSDSLREKAEFLKEFLGKFESVTFTDDPNTVGLVRKKGERLFELDYYTVEIQDGKISDIRA